MKQQDSTGMANGVKADCHEAAPAAEEHITLSQAATLAPGPLCQHRRRPTLTPAASAAAAPFIDAFGRRMIARITGSTGLAHCPGRGDRRCAADARHPPPRPGTAASVSTPGPRGRRPQRPCPARPEPRADPRRGPRRPAGSPRLPAARPRARRRRSRRTHDPARTRSMEDRARRRGQAVEEVSPDHAEKAAARSVRALEPVLASEAAGSRGGGDDLRAPKKVDLREHSWPASALSKQVAARVGAPVRSRAAAARDRPPATRRTRWNLRSDASACVIPSSTTRSPASPRPRRSPKWTSSPISGRRRSESARPPPPRRRVRARDPPPSGGSAAAPRGGRHADG